MNSRVGYLPPRIHFNLEAWNRDSHLSADEVHMEALYTITLVESIILAILSACVIFSKIAKDSIVHAATISVMASAAFGAASSYFKILNLSIYASTGIANQALQAASANFEALRDSLVALLLISIAAGWTLPVDSLPFSTSGGSGLVSGFRSPLKGLMKTPSSPASMLTIGIFAAHVCLAQWGCIANKAIDSYHDFEHLPGKILMILRIVMGLCFLMICCAQCRTRCLHSTFYIFLAIIGTLWFQSLPIVTFICNNLVPYYLRKLTVGTWDATLQTFSMIFLSWLVTSSDPPAEGLPLLQTHTKPLSPSNSPRGRSLSRETVSRSKSGISRSFSGDLEFLNLKVRID